MPTKITSEEIERFVVAYQGGKLCEGKVPIGAKLIDGLAVELVERFAAAGFALVVEEHEVEKKDLAVLNLKPIVASPALEAPVVEPAPEPAHAELVKES
jgi:hypothetical protein